MKNEKVLKSLVSSFVEKQDFSESAINTLVEMMYINISTKIKENFIYGVQEIAKGI